VRYLAFPLCFQRRWNLKFQFWFQASRDAKFRVGFQLAWNPSLNFGFQAKWILVCGSSYDGPRLVRRASAASPQHIRCYTCASLIHICTSVRSNNVVSKRARSGLCTNRFSTRFSYGSNPSSNGRIDKERPWILVGEGENGTGSPSAGESAPFSSLRYFA
jgi:hypothetical protein